MANTFKNYRSNGVSTDEVTVMTVPDATTTTIIGMSVANVGADTAHVDIKLEDTYIVKGMPISSGGAGVVVGGEQKVAATAGQKIKVISNDSNSDVIISVLEIN